MLSERHRIEHLVELIIEDTLWTLTVFKVIDRGAKFGLAKERKGQIRGKNMQNTTEKMDFIAKYLADYENKIQFQNNCGLFDAAVHFELFAQEVCKLWFAGKQFSNLNNGTYSYPCVDLVSDDRSIYVQVSTAKDIPVKITKTLNKIQKSKKADISSIKNIKFFVLNNSSIDRIKDKTVGDLTFTKETDLITTKMVLDKAKTDFVFQNAVYDLFKKDCASMIDFDNLKNAIEKSKFDISQIVHLIKDEYEIDRSKLINKIKSDKAKNIAVLGQAGYGKSVVCKKIVEGKTNVLYARAERFIKESEINNIWGFNIKMTLEGSKQSFVFFIDSLEFIADSSTKNTLLPHLFEITKSMSNVQIIVSCRTTDYNSFLQITGSYDIQTYEVGEVSEKELKLIETKYPIIRSLNTSSDYGQLLKSPLYINLIVSKITDLTSIKKENDLREYIWENIICLKDDKVKAIIKQIAFSRAKSFLLYVSSDEFDTTKIRELVSAGILLKNESLVRLKYDVFEDICFEKYFDEEFNKCRGKYGEFFESIMSMGRCVYRRYQIWVSNKLLYKVSRDRIIYSLVFSNKTTDEWKKATMIGLIRSRFSNCFFAENSGAIIKNGLLDVFVHLTNLYGFEIDNSCAARKLQRINLKPSGEGRYSLIEIIYHSGVYKSAIQVDKEILKIISDYCKLNDNKKDATTKCAVGILEYFLDSDIKEILGSKNNDLYKRHEYTISLLKPLYQLSEAAKEWIANYWRLLSEWYQGDKKWYAERIIEFTIGFENRVLVYTLAENLCALAKMFWTYQWPEEREKYNTGIPSFSERYENCWVFGLNERAELYMGTHYSDTPIRSNFFHTLFCHNFWEGVRWAVSFVNEAVSRFQTNCPKECFVLAIKFVDDCTTRKYIGNGLMWLATIEGNLFPTVLSDLLFCLQDTVKRAIEGKCANDVPYFAERVKKYIYENSNNIALLKIISYIGIEFQKELPGYALDLATNIGIICFDSQRMAINGITKKKRQYMGKSEVTVDLQQYVFDAQKLGDIRIKEKCFKILDHLYSVVPNDSENAIKYLQIQKMDLRRYKVEKINEKTVEISTSISGEAGKVVIRHGEVLKTHEEVINKILALKTKYKADKLNVMADDFIETIELILEQRIKFIPISAFDRELADYICTILELDKTLSKERREKYCQILIDGAKGYLRNVIDYQFEIDSWASLFEQLQENISLLKKNQIKGIILESVLSRLYYEPVRIIVAAAKRYLKSNVGIGTAVFNTIIKLAEDEMKHQKFNADYVLKNKLEDGFKFYPNITPKLYGVDTMINDPKKEYKSLRSKIIDIYLFKEKDIKIKEFSTDDYDFELLCYALNCGQTIENDTVFEITKKTINAIVDAMKANDSIYQSNAFYALHEIEDFLASQLTNDATSSHRVINALFGDVDFSKFTKATIKCYHNILFALTLQYFNAYDNYLRRSFIVDVFQNIENRIQVIAENEVKDELVKSLIFFIPETKKHIWREGKTKYSPGDKEFINTKLIKYGAKHLNDIILTIEKLHIKELLPEVIIPLQRLFEDARKIDETKFRITISEQKNRILLYISEAFIDFGDEIKQDDDLTKAFESLLEILCEYNFEEAAVVLDEFRIH